MPTFKNLPGTTLLRTIPLFRNCSTERKELDGTSEIHQRLSSPCPDSKNCSMYASQFEHRECKPMQAEDILLNWKHREFEPKKAQIKKSGRLAAVYLQTNT